MQSEKVKKLFLGLKFPWKLKEKQNLNRTITPVNSDDLQLKKDLGFSYISTTSDDLLALEKPISYGSRMVRIIAWVVRFKSILFQQ